MLCSASERREVNELGIFVPRAADSGTTEKSHFTCVTLEAVTGLRFVKRGDPFCSSGAERYSFTYVL